MLGPSDYIQDMHVTKQRPVLAVIRRSTIMETACRIIRRLMAQKLDMQCSLTGHGERREHTKISFRAHVAPPVIGKHLAKWFRDSLAIWSDLLISVLIMHLFYNYTILSHF